jgi:hypothetical protein
LKLGARKITIKVDNKIELKKPSALAEHNLLVKSRHITFDEAKGEWIVEAVIDSTCDGFSGTCELCHTAGLKHNFVLFNTETGETLSVGSTCIIRFGMVRGVVDVDSGVTFLQNMADEFMMIQQIKTMVNDVMVLTPDARDVSRFYNSLKKILDIRGIKNPSDDQLMEICFGSKTSKVQDPYKLGRLRMLWLKPGMIETRKSKVRYQANPKEHTTFGYKRRTRVQTTLGSSAIQANPQKYNKDEI